VENLSIIQLLKQAELQRSSSKEGEGIDISQFGCGILALLLDIDRSPSDVLFLSPGSVPEGQSRSGTRNEAVVGAEPHRPAGADHMD
jgi:hypothetical protein